MPIDQLTDTTGELEIWGLPPGTVSLIAKKRSQEGSFSSDEAFVELVEDHQPPEVELVLRRNLRLRGRVLSTRGGVPGARIKAEPLNLLMDVSTPTSDAEGYFEVDVPASAELVSFSVGAPGFAFRMLTLARDELESPQVVQVAETAGSLVIELPSGFDLYDWQSPRVFLRHGHAIEGLLYLLTWARFHGVNAEDQRFVLPFMEPGEYAVCTLSIAHRLALLNGLLPQASCASGLLTAGGELTLSLPVSTSSASSR